MAITSNTYTGNGSNKLFSITFPYLETSDIDVYLNGALQTITTQYFFANATTVEFVTAPGAGVTVLLKRSTDEATISNSFFPGSSIKAADLNDNFDQVLFLAQETNNNVASAVAGQIPDGTITNAKLAADSVASSNIIDGTIVNADVNSAAGILASKLSFTQSGSGATARTVDSKLKDVVSVKDFGAVGNGVTDDTVAIQAALDSGATEVIMPPGIYITTGVEIKAASTIEVFKGVGNATLKLTTGASRIALAVKKTFVRVSDLIITSTGTSADGNSTVGIKQESIAYTHYKNLRVSNFSLRGMQIIQGVYNTFENLTIQSCTYGLSLEVSAVNGFGCTAFTVNSAYITGCKRGIYHQSGVNGIYKLCIMEYCGDAVSSDGAFHLQNGGATLINCYWEANARNIVSIEGGIEFINRYKLAATAPDIITYSATPFDFRGTTVVDSNTVSTRFLKPDSDAGYDLQLGTNLIAPLAGGSVKFGDTTTETLTGIATASTWTTVKAIPATEMTGATQQKTAYFYTIYAGYADLPTGFDFGTIFNDTLRSFTGTTPAWLRLNTQNIQVNIASSSYGLTYKLVLHRIFPGTV